MFDKIIIVVIFIIIILIGSSLNYFKIKKLKQNRDFTNTFREDFFEYFNSNPEKSELYTQLIYNSNRMQRILGYFGILSKFRPPFANYILSNIEILSTFLPEIRKSFHENILRKQSTQYAQAIDDATLRYLGSVDEQIKAYKLKYRNPIKLFKDGIYYIISLPFEILRELNLIPSFAFNLLIKSLSLISGIATLITIVSGMVTLILGWKDFSDIITNTYIKLFN